MKIRLNKFLSNAGTVSRRRADELIQSGQVSINGKTVKKLGVIVNEDKDVVTLNSKKIKNREKKYYIAMNKPVGYVVSRRSFPGQKNVYDLLPRNFKMMVWPIGRLDKDSEGLIFFTNDGDLTQKITHPKFGNKKIYLVRTNHELSEFTLNRLRNGVRLEEGSIVTAQIKRKGYAQYVFEIREGKKRQIRRMVSSVGAKVVRLKRIQINNFILDNLKSGQWKFIAKKDIVS